MAAGLLSLAFAVIMGLTIYDFVHQYGVPGGPDVTLRATRYISQGQEESAINLLSESIQLKSSSHDSHTAEWSSLLDKALYSQGKKLAAQGKFRDAVTAFARISPDFAEHAEVEGLIAEYSERGLPLGFGKVEDNDTLESSAKEKLPLSKIEKAVMTAVPGGKKRVEPLLPQSDIVPGSTKP